MLNDEKSKNALSIWTLKNTAPITKIGIEGTVAAASLATAVATVLIATNVIAGPAFLVSVANPAGIVALFVAAVYFTAAAYSSYQQVHKKDETIEAGITGRVEEAVKDAKIADKVTQAVNSVKSNLVNSDQVVSTFLTQLKQGQNLTDVKAALGIQS